MSIVSSARLIFVLLIVSAPSFLIGCSHRKIPVIRILGEDSSNLKAMEELKGGFEDEMQKEGHPVKVVFEKASYEDAGERSNQDFIHKTGKYDIVLQYNFSLANFASHNYVLKTRELTPLVPQGVPAKIEQSLFSNVWHEVGWYYKDNNGSDQAVESVGYPFAANTMLLVYNRRFFDDHSLKNQYRALYHAELLPPQDWDTFKNEAAFFSSITKNHCGVALEGKSDGWLYYEWANVLYNFGGTVMRKQYGWEGGRTTQLELNTQTAIRAASYYASLKPYNCGDFFNTDAPTQRELLLGNDVPLALVWSDYLFEFVQRYRAKHLSFGFLPVPGDHSMIGGGAYYVSRQSKQKELAARFIFYLLEPKNQIILARAGLCSPVRDTYEDPVAMSIPYMPALATSLKRSSYMLEAGPDSLLIRDQITNALQEIWRGNSADNTMNDLQTNLTLKRSELFEQLQ